ncbi:MAG TPA: AAA domain-containing protein [Blastocatellia bacterium]|nr:AAA domain-containing protein [Blastocatellia bacterium]
MDRKMAHPDHPEPGARGFAVEHKLGAHRLAQYVTRNRCRRYLRLALFPSEANALKSRYGVEFESLSPLLSAEGHAFERGKVNDLRARGERVVDLTNKNPDDFIRELSGQTQARVYYYQPALEGFIGGCPCGGQADLIELTRRADGSFDCTVIDIKASPRETVGFRLQVAFYAVLLREGLLANGLKVASLNGAIAARDADFSEGGWNLFDLGLFVDEIERLIAAPASDVERAASVSFETAQYHLGPHCDGCPYNSLCFINTAEREDLSLVPLLSATEKSALQAEGVRSVRELAGLMNYSERGMEAAEGRESEVARIGRRWPLGSRLPLLVQRARVALQGQGETVEQRRLLYGSGWGSLPDSDQFPGLVKVFIDAQRDHLKDRLYLLAALVRGPSGSGKIIEMTDEPPETEAERALLISWVQKLLPAVRRAAGEPDAPLHVYLYDRRGQRSLLDALARHFDALCAMPAFYDLLTSTPALTQSMISFLGDEVSERKNIRAICRNLYEVARALGFKWRGENADVPGRFRARIFDNLRLYARDREGMFIKAPEGGAGYQAVWVESSARFGTEIPLEYAYAAWGMLGDAAEMEPKARQQVRGFLGTEREHIEALADARLEALLHIEQSFNRKNRRIEKPPLALGRLHEVEVDPASVPLRRSLEDFLRLEHYAGLQERLLHFALAPALRAETGRTALLLCEAFHREGKLAAFTISDANGDPASVAQAGALRFREGDWVVLNPLLDAETGEPPAGKRVAHGRLAVVEQIEETRMTLRLLPLNFQKSEFRFTHRMIEPERGLIYSIDEMADDLNADKFLEACRSASSNVLYRWLEDPRSGREPRDSIRPSRLRAAARVSGLAHEAQAPHGLTESQRGVIGRFLSDKVVVLQGPPGTGKSHTLGFATISRALALATPARPFRVAVCARTHSAAQIAVASIRARADQLRAEGLGGNGVADPLLAPLECLKVFKICNDSDEPLPEGVEPLLAEGRGKIKAPEQWGRLLSEKLLVIGGTPGGLYNVIKRGASKGRAVDWGEKYFDLVLVDEASQMGIAEALLAAAFLRQDGQFIAIGDHRQMPPILAHAWDQESRRDLERARPHLSIFEYLRELGFACAALDESFRIPSEVADFLRRHVYASDGVNLHSQNRRRLPGLKSEAPLDLTREWVRAALAPEHALVVVEHGESGSQRANEFEAGLITELAEAAGGGLGLDAKDGLGIVVPHRAQKFLLRQRLPAFSDAIDTVERFQGGERELIIVSATVSDQEFALTESDFLLEPRRFTVAISRPKRKVIVIASRAVFDLVPADLDAYERGSLWKHLRHEARLLWQGEVNGERVSVRAVDSEA